MYAYDTHGARHCCCCCFLYANTYDLILQHCCTKYLVIAAAASTCTDCWLGRLESGLGQHDHKVMARVAEMQYMEIKIQHRTDAAMRTKYGQNTSTHEYTWCRKL